MFESSVELGDKIVIIDNKTGIKSPEGFVFEVDMGVATISVNGIRMDVDGEKLIGKTVFGSCTIEVVRAKGKCSKCGARNQTGNYCSNCSKKVV